MPSDRISPRYVPGAERSPALVDLTAEFRHRDNADFYAEVARRLADLARTPGPAFTHFDPAGAACIGLTGGYGLLSYGVRQAQDILRVDRSPSHWSHAFLLFGPLSEDPSRNRDPHESGWLWESTLEPDSLFNWSNYRNGVTPRRLADYARGDFELLTPRCTPNVAVLSVALTADERARILEQADDPVVASFKYDLLGLLGTWYAYLTNRARQPNPLTDGNAVFCSAYVQLAYEAAGLDLAPGAHARNTAPEHLWQAFNYFSDTFLVTDPVTGQQHPRPTAGWYCIRDQACVLAPYDSLRGLPGRLTDFMRRLLPGSVGGPVTDTPYDLMRPPTSRGRSITPRPADGPGPADATGPSPGS